MEGETLRTLTSKPSASSLNFSRTNPRRIWPLLCACALFLLGCESLGPAVILRLSQLTPEADTIQVMVLLGDVGQEQVAQEMPLFPVASPNQREYTVGLRLPFGTTGRVVVGVAAYNQLRDCLLATGSAAIVVNAVADVQNGIPLYITPMSIGTPDCGHQLSVPRILGEDPMLQVVNDGDQFTVAGWGLAPASVLSVNGMPARPAAWMSPTSISGTVPRLPGYLGPLTIALSNSITGQLLTQSTGLYRYLHRPSFNAVDYEYRSDGITTPPEDLIAVDLDGDKRNDLVVLWYDAANDQTVMTILLSGPDALQAPVHHFFAGVRGTRLAAGNLDGSGGPDLVFATATQITILANSGNARFDTPAQSYPIASDAFAEVSELVVADLNRDGRADAAVIYVGGADQASATTRLLVLLNDGAGGLGTAAPVGLPKTPYFFSIADFAGAGAADLAVTYRDPSTKMLLAGVDLFRNSGAATFNPLQSYGGRGGKFLVADLSRDGRADLIFQDAVLVNNGSGGVTAGDPLSAAGQIPLAVGSLNGDAELDVAFDSGYLLSLGPLGQGEPGLRKFPDPPLLVADLNQDGLLDAVATSMMPGMLTVYTNGSLAP